jgi:hypothetical protein
VEHSLLAKCLVDRQARLYVGGKIADFRLTDEALLVDKKGPPPAGMDVNVFRNLVFYAAIQHRKSPKMERERLRNAGTASDDDRADVLRFGLFLKS